MFLKNFHQMLNMFLVNNTNFTVFHAVFRKSSSFVSLIYIQYGGIQSIQSTTLASCHLQLLTGKLPNSVKNCCHIKSKEYVFKYVLVSLWKIIFLNKYVFLH